MIVSKFGGSSLSCGDAFKKVKEIVSLNKERKIIVVSAPGKKNKSDKKVTDLLYECSFRAKKGVSCSDLIENIKKIYTEIQKKLKLKTDVERQIFSIEKALSDGADESFIVSRGEYLSAILTAEMLGYSFVDAKNVLLFNYTGNLDENLSREALNRVIEKNERIVVPGFYGGYYSGKIKLFSRGGSDVTGGLIAGLLNAELYENWTDVSGVMTVDPKIYPNSNPVEQMTYEDIRQLSFFGAGVLNEKTLRPVREAKVPLVIKNTKRPKDKGTVISFNPSKTSFIVGIAIRDGFFKLCIKKKEADTNTRLLIEVLAEISFLKLETEHVFTDADAINLIIKGDAERSKMLASNMSIKHGKEVELEEDVSVIGVILNKSDGSIIPKVLGKDCLCFNKHGSIAVSCVKTEKAKESVVKIYNSIYSENN